MEDSLASEILDEVAIGRLKWTKTGNIERLEEVRGMGWKTFCNNIIL
jgi:hypothetical protein